MFLAVEVDHVTRLGGLGFEVEAVVFVARHDVRNAAVDLDAVLGELLHFLGVVGDELDRPNLERHEHVRGHGVVAFVVAEAQRQVGLHGVEALVLQAVGADLVDQPDAAAFLTQVEHDALVHLADHLERGFELVAAIAAQRADHVARQALGVQTHGHILGAEDLALDDGNVFLLVAVIPEGHDVEIAEARGQFGNGLDADADLILAHAFAFVTAVLVQQQLDLFVRECGHVFSCGWDAVPPYTL